MSSEQKTDQRNSTRENEIPPFFYDAPAGIQFLFLTTSFKDDIIQVIESYSTLSHHHLLNTFNVNRFYKTHIKDSNVTQIPLKVLKV